MFGFGKKKVAPKAPTDELEVEAGDDIQQEDLNADMGSDVKQGAKKGKNIKIISVAAAVVVVGAAAGVTLLSMGGGNTQPVAEVTPRAKINAPKVEAKVANDVKLEQDRDTGVYTKKKEEDKPVVIAKDKAPEKSDTDEVNMSKSIKVATPADTKLLDGKTVADEVKMSTDEVKKELVDALAIGGGGTLDAFLQKYQKTIDNKQLEEQIESNIRVMETAYKFLNTKLKYDETVENYADKLNEVANRGRRADLREEFNAELRKMEQSVASLKKDNEVLREAIETTRKAGKTVQDGSGQTYVQHDEASQFDGNGFVRSGDNVYLAGTYNGVNYTQTIYRIGDTYIMEEIDDLGNITVFKQGMVYRGGMISSIGQDMINLKRGAVSTIISVGGSGSGSQNSYNYVTIGMPAQSSIKNSEQVRPQNAPAVREYRDVQAERARAEAASMNESNFFSTPTRR